MDRGATKTKTSPLSKRRAVVKAEEFPQNFIDVCIRKSSRSAFPALLVRTALRVMQDGAIVKTGYFTGLFVKPEGVQSSDFAENYLDSFRRKILMNNHIQHRHVNTDKEI